MRLEASLKYDENLIDNENNFKVDNNNFYNSISTKCEIMF